MHAFKSGYGRLSVAAVYTFLTDYFFNNAGERFTSSAGIRQMRNFSSTFLPNRGRAMSNGARLFRDSLGTEFMWEARRSQSSCVRPAKEVKTDFTLQVDVADVKET